MPLSALSWHLLFLYCCVGHLWVWIAAMCLGRWRLASMRWIILHWSMESHILSTWEVSWMTLVLSRTSLSTFTLCCYYHESWAYELTNPLKFELYQEKFKCLTNQMMELIYLSICRRFVQWYWGIFWFCRLEFCVVCALVQFSGMHFSCLLEDWWCVVLMEKVICTWLWVVNKSVLC